ncbi:hypothetical protein [Streptomyces graminilatus]|uniref:hypothetical protein n=1 Tax=Streptomyces graminilatus TaxID=1464070 RepID=UPI0006E21F3C|nr:hypothetical protein [Streptomyces graminilatus]
MRARNILLASGHRTPHEEVRAYRVLAQVSPASYLPLLARALQDLSYNPIARKPHPAALALCEEAVAAARAIGPAEPGRADVLYRALDSCQHELYNVGRRTEGFAMRAEMLAIGRAQAELSGDPRVDGLSIWAAGLSEEGRYAEAADALTEWVAAILPGGPGTADLTWSLLEWIATLDAAGRPAEALAAFETLVGIEAVEAARRSDAVACHLFSLIGYARMLDAHGQGERATAVRQEALASLTELAATHERRTWYGRLITYWTVLLSFSGADSERPLPGEPRPPSGRPLMRWSSDVRRRYFDSRIALREQVDALASGAAEEPDRHLAELVRLHRVLTVRSAVHWVRDYYNPLLKEQVTSLFDEGVVLARRLSEHHPADGTRALAEVLVDRSTFHLAEGDVVAALDDFREALSHLGEATD